MFWFSLGRNKGLNVKTSTTTASATVGYTVGYLISRAGCCFMYVSRACLRLEENGGKGWNCHGGLAMTQSPSRAINIKTCQAVSKQNKIRSSKTGMCRAGHFVRTGLLLPDVSFACGCFEAAQWCRCDVDQLLPDGSHFAQIMIYL